MNSNKNYQHLKYRNMYTVQEKKDKNVHRTTLSERGDFWREKEIVLEYYTWVTYYL